MSTKEEGVSFSPREMQVLALAWQCFDTDPKVRLPASLSCESLRHRPAYHALTPICVLNVPHSS